LLGPEVAHRDTICREIMLDGCYEKDLLATMVELVPDTTSTFLDIGANVGNHSIYLSKHFRRVISFEPVPRNCWIQSRPPYQPRPQNHVGRNKV
jgi:hypothetical protein